ncbi:MAG: hypothetical protein JF587_25075 [Catenulisporales bacterium]|nr:hypothetical protein [Catenulisporales bacterium]
MAGDAAKRLERFIRRHTHAWTEREIVTDWSFELELNHAPTNDELDELYEAGLDDCDVTTSPDGGARLSCDRAAETMLDAVASVVHDVRKVPGLRVASVVHNDDVTLGEAAQRLGRSAQNLHQFAKGERGPGRFPKPKNPAGPTRFYSYAEIVRWMREALGLDVPESNLELVLADMLIRAGVLADAVQRSPERFFQRAA